MFTGIIESTGEIISRKSYGGDIVIEITSQHFNFSTCALGDSIAVNGVCLTIVEKSDQHFRADISNETLSLTTLNQLKIGTQVNLERALTLNTPLGGHLISGHVDGIVQLIDRYPDARCERMHFHIPSSLSLYIAKKGSVAVDGVSLTVNDIVGDIFSVNIVPHTLEHTTLGNYTIGDSLNLEVDIIARYVQRLLNMDTSNALHKNITEE